MQATEFYHEPVLLAECLEFLNIRPEGVFADCTLGGGGHSEAISGLLGERGVLHCFDRDPEAIAFARKRLQNAQPKIVYHEVPFGNLSEEVESNSLDGVLYDLGISSRQVDSAERGFTFAGETPLDLRMDTRQDLDAQKWLRSASEEDLAKAFRENADLEKPLKLAKLIKHAIGEEPILPADIRSAALKTYPEKRRDINGILARIFQAIRMEVNGELAEIEKSLDGAVECLKPSGRMVVISYHSAEDRRVKQVAAKWERDCICPPNLPLCTCGGNHKKLRKVLRKPVLPSAAEVARNPRARSAKLRVYERV